MNMPTTNQSLSENTVEDRYAAEFQQLVVAMERASNACPELSIALLDQEKAVLKYRSWECKVEVAFVPSRNRAHLSISTGKQSSMSRRNSIDLLLQTTNEGNSWVLPGGRRSIGSSNFVAEVIVQSAKASVFWLEIMEEHLKVI